MERWDFDCQRCRKNIGDAWYADMFWYKCPQHENSDELLERVYPRFVFNEDGSIVSGTFPSQVGKHTLDFIKQEYLSKDMIEVKKHLGKCYCAFPLQSSVFIIDYSRHEAVWSTNTHGEEWYEKAGIKKHPLRYRRSNLGYTLDVKCAQEFDYKCPACDTPLVKVTADQHPGGRWGVRGVREPAPMRHPDLIFKGKDETLIIPGDASLGSLIEEAKRLGKRK